MGESAHLSPEALSAFLDRELGAAEAASARAHLGSCGACAGDLAQFDRLDAVLASPAPLGCAAAAVVLSARLDREADAAEVALAEHHLIVCAGCRGRVAAWAAAEALLAGPILLPPARVDAAMAALVRVPAAPRGPRATPPRGLPVRAGLGGLATAALAVALVLALPQAGLAPDEARFDPTLVASLQTVVFDPRSNTLYVAEPETGTVAAFDAATNVLRLRISVGGRPTALALHAGTLYALDPERKTLTEIATARNAIIGSTQLAISGTLTGLHIEPASGKIAISSTVPPSATAQPRATGAPGGYVTVLDPRTRQVESVRPLDAPGSQVVYDELGTRAAVVSVDATSVVDPTTLVEIARLPGGVDAAYATGSSDLLAILAKRSGGTLVHFSGSRAPEALRLEGEPRSILALPGGEFGVLVDLGTRARIVVIDRSGRETMAFDVPTLGRDLVAYDAGAKRFSIAGADGISFANVPQAAAAVPTPTPPAPSSPPPASPTPGPTASAAPSAPAVPTAPTAVSLPSTPSVPRAALRIAEDVYRVGIPGGRAPRLVSAAHDRVWYIDSANTLGALNADNANVLSIAYLPAEARPTLLAAGRRFVYAIDPVAGELFVLSVADEKLSARVFPFVRGAVAAAVGADDKLWVAQAGSRYLFSYEPGALRVEALPTQLENISAVAAGGGRLWFVDEKARVAGSFDEVKGLTSRALPAFAALSAVHADALGRLWLGTVAGEIFAAREESVVLARRALRPISALATDQTGRAHYLIAAPGVAGSFLVDPVDGVQRGRLVPGPATSLSFTSAGRAWLADASGGFFLALETSR